MIRNPRDLRNPAASLLGAAGLVAVFTLISRVFGFLRWLAQASWVGAAEVGNAYASANQIPNVIFEVAVGGALASITVPLLAKAIARNSRQEVSGIASALLTWTLTILIPLGLVLFLAADPIAALLPASRGSDWAAQNALMAQFLRAFAIQIPLYGLAVVAGGILQAYDRFAWPAAMPALSSLVVMLAYGLYGWWSRADTFDARALNVLGWGTSLGVALLGVPLVIPLVRLGLRLRPTWVMSRAQLRQALALGGFGIGSLLAAQGYMLAVLVLARWGGQVGTINVFQYAQAVYLLPYALFTYPVATVVFPLLTRSEAAGQHQECAQLAAASTALIAALAVLGVAGLVAVAPGMAAIFAWNRPIPGLELAIVAVSPALLGYALLYHLSRVVIALNRAVHSLVAALLAWGVAAVTAWILIKVLVPGLGAGAESLLALGWGQTVGMSLAGGYLVVVWQRIQPGGWRVVSLALVVTLPLAVLGAAGGRLIYRVIVALDVPLAVLWATLAAGAVVVVVSLPGLYLASVQFRGVVRRVRSGGVDKVGFMRCHLENEAAESSCFPKSSEGDQS
ncbi:murein biosynthesis integral membrane protein MurJ [Mobiluncus mulieris]|uniref:Virulence factor MviN n=1 Tax=Mobiluncus mulieris TaxID=2052 RepID=A0ABD4U0I1_9ACTO|nr:lipid II flippase MurJ [Mobiluncus mulieris]MCU9969581.1 virulence factor MviN [Mobiluncus mulieris]MCU9972506.1 virulence factor MviN [Mobiluncus mulieris]MCV0009955.1 virulence factor MviN [Mobiluncus mulieris]NMW75716.1 virulence factor MviN [Mobiluncus mulieris]